MRILNFGSLNLDFVYRVDHIARPGETIASKSLSLFRGGKGLNQSIAMARAGLPVWHAGMVGPDGAPLLEACRENGVNTDYIKEVSERSGNAIIQVSEDGENSIILFGGANQRNDRAFVDQTLSHFRGGDILLLQNEVNCLDYMISSGADRGMRVFLNASPYNATLSRCDLSLIDLFFVNEVEGERLTGKNQPEAILEEARSRFPGADIALTLGGDGAMYLRDGKIYHQGAYEVPVVDTTAAGDTFTGYFIAALLAGKSPEDILREACVAAALAISRPGAEASIPFKPDVDAARLNPR